MKLDSFVFSSSGGRELNEDHVGHRMLDNGEMFILADGLGGHHGGELASECVVEYLLNAPFDKECDPGQWLEQEIGNANVRVAELQQKEKKKMKSTVTVLLIVDSTAVWAHVGDSRVYHFREGRIENVTADHSVAYKKYKAGELTRDQIGQDEDQSSLLRALGNPERNKPDISDPVMLPGENDAFMLCSDGLWTLVKDQEILTDRLKSDSAKQWGELLLLRFMEKMTPSSDNVSVITVMI